MNHICSSKSVELCSSKVQFNTKALQVCAWVAVELFVLNSMLLDN